MKALKARHAERIRFGILSAREDFEFERLTPGHRAFLDECSHGALLLVGDTGTREPYNRELWNIRRRLQ